MVMNGFNSHKGWLMNKKLAAPFFLFFLLILAALSACAPLQPAAASGDGIVRVVLFWTPGCSSCEKALTEIIPPLESKYGAKLQVLKVPLNNLDEVNRLYAAADFFKIKKDDILTPFVLVGTEILSGEPALSSGLDQKIQAGIAAGGLAHPALPPALAELAARSTPTPKANAAPGIEGPGVSAPTKPAAPGACVINTPCPTTKP
jgi:thiol-disulfide isomerase/thioredoxin